MTLPVIEAGAVDAAWLSAALRAAGKLEAGEVERFTATPIGNGLVGSSLRFDLNYSAQAQGPASIVGKFPADDPASRHSGISMQLYLREVAFYREVARHTAMRTPRVLASAFDPGTHGFALLFEDLAPARPGDQLLGCPPEDAQTALAELALLHAPFWNAPLLASWDWLGTPEPVAVHLAAMVPAVAAEFRARFESVLEPEIMAAVQALVPLAQALMLGRAAQNTVLHGDFRLDNLLFDAQGGELPMVTLDWQTVAKGCGTLDASYFIGAGLASELRGRHEVELLQLYHAALLAGGVRGYGLEECWRDYRKHSLNGLFMAMFSAVAVQRTPRGDAMFLTMARRHGLQALELDAFSLW